MFDQHFFLFIFIEGKTLMTMRKYRLKSNRTIQVDRKCFDEILLSLVESIFSKRKVEKMRSKTKKEMVRNELNVSIFQE